MFKNSGSVVFIYKLNKLICLPIKGLHDINKKFDYSDVLEAK
jgi:hypothetical protein